MEITHNSNNLLVIEHKPWKLPLFLLIWGLIWMVLTIINFNILSAKDVVISTVGVLSLFFMCYFTLRQSCITFDSKLNKIVWIRGELFKTVKGECKLDSVKDVIKQQSTDTEGTDYRLAIRLHDNSVIPIVYHYSTVEPHDEILTQIKSWMKSNLVMCY